MVAPASHLPNLSFLNYLKKLKSNFLNLFIQLVLTCNAGNSHEYVELARITLEV